MKHAKYGQIMLGFLLFSTARNSAMAPAGPTRTEIITGSSAPAMPMTRSTDPKVQLQESMQFCEAKMQEITQKIEELKREYSYYKDTLTRNKKGKF
jgi:hypothetical protein